MARVVIVTEQGEEVGEVPVHEAPASAAKYAHGWDGIEFERLWAEALRRENVAAMQAEIDTYPA